MPENKPIGRRRGSVIITFLLLLATVMTAGNVPVAADTSLTAANPSPTPRQDMSFVTDGIVYAATTAGDITYIGGDFRSVGPNTGQGVLLDATTASPLSTYPKVNGPVNASVPDGSGGFYIGGEFTGVGGVARNNIAHVLSTGTVDPDWDPNCNYVVNALAVSEDGSTIYAGGWFNEVNGGTSRSCAAAFNNTDGTATGWDPQCDTTVLALAVSGSTVYVGGKFKNVKGYTSRNYAAAFDGTTGALDTAWNPSFNNYVNALAVSEDGSTIYAGGNFTTAGGTARNYAAAFDTGGTITSWDPDFNTTVYSLAVDGSTVYAGGDFNYVNETININHIAAVDDDDGTADTTWNPLVTGGAARAIAVTDNAVYAGGVFDHVASGATTRNHAAAFNKTDGTATDWDPDCNNDVYALAVSGSTVFTGGKFTSMGGTSVARNYAAAFNNIDGTLTAWDPNCDGIIWALAASEDGSTIYAGGDFYNVNNGDGYGIYRRHAAAFNNTDGTATGWDLNCNGAVLALAVSGSTVYAGGLFTQVNGSYGRDYIAAVSGTTGNAHVNWDADCSSTVRAIDVSEDGSTIYAGGYFVNVNGGTSRMCAAAFNNTDGTATDWNPNFDNVVEALAISEDGSTIYVGGEFSTVNGGTGRNRIAAFNNTDGTATDWNPNCNSTVFSLAVSEDGSTVYAGGYFTTVNGGTDRKRIAALNNTDGTATDWNPGCSNPSQGITAVRELVVSGSTVYAGGDFYGAGAYASAFFSVFQGPPVVNAITPDAGINDSTLNVTDLAGTNFYGEPGVKLQKAGEDDITATNVQLESTGKITCDLPLAGAATGQWDVVVTNPDSQEGTLAGGLTVGNIAPSISSISPVEKKAGDNGFTLTVNGGNFIETSSVRWDGSALDTTYVSPAKLTASVPASSIEEAGKVDVTVVNPAPGGGTSNAKTLTVNKAPINWYLAEGTTAWGFNTYISIENPNDSDVDVDITYNTSDGEVSGGTITLPPMSQTTVNPSETVPDKDFSTLVTAEGGETIAVDRTMEWTGTGATAPEAHNSIGVTAPAKTWYLPEGSTNWDFETWLLIQNPGDTDATCQVTYMIEGSDPVTLEKSVPAGSRQSYSMADDIGNKDASIKVQSNVPVIPERSMYRYNRREGHDSIGTTTPANDYYLAEGAVGYDSNYLTYVLVQNPQAETNRVTVTYLTGTGEVAGPTIDMPANSRTTIKVNDHLPPGTDVSTHVHGESPIIAERAVYWNSTAGEACHDSIGMSAPHSAFYLPDGESSNGRETWTLVSNPNDSDVQVEIAYLPEGGGTPVLKDEVIPANSRKSFNMQEHSGINGRASVMVTGGSGKKIMVERAMYWNSRAAGTDTIGGYSD